MQEQIEAALAAARGGHLKEVIDELAGIDHEKINAVRFAASRGNVEEIVEHLNAVLASMPPAIPRKQGLFERFRRNRIPLEEKAMWGTKRKGLPYWVPSRRYLRDADPEEIEIARERGRQGAALIYREDAGKRAEGERIFGIDYMRHRYPEAYVSPKRFIDLLRWWSTS